MHQQTAGDYPPNPRHELSHRLRIAGEHHPGAEAPGPRRAATPLAAGGLQPGRARTLASQPVAAIRAALAGADDPLRATPVDPGGTCTGGDHALCTAMA